MSNAEYTLRNTAYYAERLVDAFFTASFTVLGK